jgi:hypothetical protein
MMKAKPVAQVKTGEAYIRPAWKRHREKGGSVEDCRPARRTFAMEYHIHDNMNAYQVVVRETRPVSKAGRMPSPMKTIAAISRA